jgi:hypothetical protein
MIDENGYKTKYYCHENGYHKVFISGRRMKILR